MQPPLEIELPPPLAQIVELINQLAQLWRDAQSQVFFEFDLRSESALPHRV